MRVSNSSTIEIYNSKLKKPYFMPATVATAPVAAPVVFKSAPVKKIPQTNPDGTKIKRVSKKEKAKLNYFPRRFARTLKVYLGNKQLSDPAVIAFAAGIESVIGQVLEPAMEAAIPDKRIRLQPKDIHRGIQSNPALAAVFADIVPRSEYMVPAFVTPRVKKSATVAAAAAAVASATRPAATAVPVPAAAAPVAAAATA